MCQPPSPLLLVLFKWFEWETRSCLSLWKLSSAYMSAVYDTILLCFAALGRIWLHMHGSFWMSLSRSCMSLKGGNIQKSSKEHFRGSRSEPFHRAPCGACWDTLHLLLRPPVTHSGVHSVFLGRGFSSFSGTVGYRAHAQHLSSSEWGQWGLVGAALFE